MGDARKVLVLPAATHKGVGRSPRSCRAPSSLFPLPAGASAKWVRQSPWPLTCPPPHSPAGAFVQDVVRN